MSTHTFFEFHKMPVCILSCCCRTFVEFSSRWKSLYSSSKWESWKTTRDLLQCHPSILNNTKHMHSEKNYKFIIIINFVEDCIPFRGNRFIRGNLLLWLKIDHFTKMLLFIQVHIALIRSALSDFTKRERFFIKYLIARFAQLPLFKLHFYSRKGRS